MKRRSIISAALAASILASMAGSLSADSHVGTTYYDGQYFNWELSNSTLIVDQADSAAHTVANVTGYADSVSSMYVGDWAHVSQEYTFGGFAEDFNDMSYIRVKYRCTEFNNVYRYPNLQTLDIYNNLLDEIYLDFTETDYDVLPKITLSGGCNEDLKVTVDLQDFDNTYVTIPAGYGYPDINIFYDFRGSGSLESVTFEEGTEVIRDSAFMNCGDLESVNIPYGVTMIEYQAFYGCDSLNSIELPSSIEEIKYDAFEESGITDIYYDGTISDWYGLVSIRDNSGDVIGNVLALDGVTVHCSDADMYIRKDEDGENRQAPIGWVKEDGHWRYYNDNGGMNAGNTFHEISGKTYFFDNNGYMATGWKQIGGDWYFFGTNGIMRTGWAKSGKSWYYFNSDGIMETGWQKISGKWYYLGTDGAMKTGWQSISGMWYYFNTSGEMQTGWQKISNKWYYFASGGEMYANKWLKSGGKWYYFGSDGAMLSNTSRKIGNKTYNFDSNGVCTNP